jgi:putative ATP-binding cassette transporter
VNSLTFLLRKSWRLVVFATISGVVSGLASAVVISLVSEASTIDEPRRGRLGIAFLLLVALSVGAKFASETILTRLGQNAIAEIRLHLARRVLGSPFRRIEELGPSRIVAALTDDATAIAQAFMLLPLVCVNAAAVLGCLLYLGVSSKAALALAVLSMLLGGLLFRAHERRGARHLRASRETNDLLFGYFRSLTDGIKELKMTRARGSEFVAKLLGESVRAYERDTVSGMAVYSLANAWGALIFFLVVGVVALVLPAIIGLPSDVVVRVTLTLVYLMGPFAQLMEMLPAISRAGVALDKCNDLGLALGRSTFDEVAREQSGSSLRAGGGRRLRLELVNLTYRYPSQHEDSPFRVGPVNLTLEAGELVFVVGGNGSGKTTLSLLVLGLYTPDGGEIVVDGVPVNEANRGEYRELFSVVFANYHLFTELLDLTDPTQRERAQRYLDRLQLNGRVRIDGHKLSVDGLSQGQRKRLALLVALLDDRPIYLFDEWASDQDPEFRRIFYREILPELRALGKTVVVITHDDGYFSVADRCLRMDYGQVQPFAKHAMAQRSLVEAI